MKLALFFLISPTYLSSLKSPITFICNLLQIFKINLSRSGTLLRLSICNHVLSFGAELKNKQKEKKKMKKRTINTLVITLLAISSQAVVITESFDVPAASPWNGIADNIWVGDLANLNATGTELKTTAVGIQTIVTDMGSGNNEGSWTAHMSGRNRGLDGNDRQMLVISSDSSDATAIEAGTITGLRLLWQNGDYLALEQATGSGWIQIDRDDQANAGHDLRNQDWTIGLTAAGVLTYSVVDNHVAITRTGSFDLGGAYSLGQYTGVSLEHGNHFAEVDSFSANVIPERHPVCPPPDHDVNCFQSCRLPSGGLWMTIPAIYLAGFFCVVRQHRFQAASVPRVSRRPIL
jgi:hypothetical protein